MGEYSGRVDFSKLQNINLSLGTKIFLGILAISLTLTAVSFIPNLGQIEVTHVESPTTGEMVDVEDTTFSTSIMNMVLAEQGYCESAEGVEMRCDAIWTSLLPI